MSAPKMFAADCGACGLPQAKAPVHLFVLTADAEGLIVRWQCAMCGTGWYRPTRLTLAACVTSGMFITRAAREYMGARCGPALGLHLHLPDSTREVSQE